jgi:hypothetical protein
VKKRLIFTLLAVLLFAGLSTQAFAQATATLEIRNYTGYYINIYINDIYVGQIYPYKVADVSIPYGDDVLYAKAPYTNIVWGPTEIYDNGWYTWNLTEY